MRKLYVFVLVILLLCNKNVSAQCITLASVEGSDMQVVCINAPITNITYVTQLTASPDFEGLPPGVSGVWNPITLDVTIRGAVSIPGIYNYTLIPSSGCDTIVRGRITVNNAPVINVTPALTCGASAATVAVNELQSDGPVSIVNPDFEIIYKTGSTTVTAPLFPPGTGPNGTTNTGLNGPEVIFSDGSAGSVFDVPGWEWNTNILGFENQNGHFTPDNRRDMVVWINGLDYNGTPSEQTLSQVLNVDVQQLETYTLTADFGWRDDNEAEPNPPVLRLYSGSTLLIPISSTNPAFEKGHFVTYTRKYFINNPGISGPLKIEIGKARSVTGQQLNIDHVTLAAKKTTGYTYLWDTDPLQTDSTATGLSGGVYNVTVTDFNFCSTTAPVTIIPYPVPNIAGSNAVSICNGSGISLGVSGAEGYSWSPAGGLSQTTGNSVIANPADTTIYIVTATDQGECSDTITINVKSSPVIISQATEEQTICQGEVALPLSVTATGTGLSYQWYSNANPNNTNGREVGTNSSSYTPSTATGDILFYYCVVSGECSPPVTSAISGAIVINTAPAIIDQSTPSLDVCLNDTIETAFSVIATGSRLTYRWYRNTSSGYDGAIPVSEEASYIPSTSTAGTFYYYCVVSGECSPPFFSDMSGAVTIGEATHISRQPSIDTQILCLNNSAASFSVTANAAIQYQWYVNTYPNNTNGTPLEGMNSSSFTPTTDNPGTKYYYCVVTGACSSETSDISGAVMVYEPVTITNQPSNIYPLLCLHAAATPLSVSANAAQKYQWYSNTSANTTGGTEVGTDSSSYTPSTETPSTNFYYCIVTGPCSSVTSDISDTVIVKPLPVAIIQGPDTVCINSSPAPILFTGSDGTSPYLFEYNINGLPPRIAAGNGAGSVDISTDTAGTFNYNLISVSDNFGCTQAQPKTVTVTVKALPTALIAGTATVCQNSGLPAIKLTGSNGPGPYTFVYSVNDSSETHTANAINDSVFLDVSTATTGSFLYRLISVSDYNGCTGPADGTAAVIVKPLPEASITGTDSVCQNSTPPLITFTGSNGTAPYTFVYGINELPITRTVSVTNNSSVVYALTDSTGIFNYRLISVIDINGCTQIQSGTAIINVIRNPFLISAKTLTVCDNTELTYDAADANGSTTFKWTRDIVSGISNPIGNGTTKNITETLNNITAFPVVVPYYFTLFTGQGCITKDSIFVTVNPTPVIDPIRDTAYCNGENAAAIYFSSPSPNVLYTWTIDTTVGFGTGPNRYINPFTATNPDTARLTGTVTVTSTVSDSLRCAGDTASFKIIVNPSAATPGFTWLNLKNGTLCREAQNINFYVNPADPGTSYLWTVIPSDPGVAIKDMSHANTVISFNKTGSYKVSVLAINNNGLCQSTVSQTIYVSDTPGIQARKIILKQPNILVYPDNTMDSAGYQWGYDELIIDSSGAVRDSSLGQPVKIPGQVYQFFIPTNDFLLDGDKLDTTKYKFWVLLQKDNCYTKVYYNGPYAQQRIQVQPPEDNSVRLKVVPNPNNGSFGIDLKGNMYGNIDATVYNSIGQLVFTKQFVKTTADIFERLDKNNLPNGLYYLVLNSSDLKKAVTRFIIQH